jgi:hypothetical protein
MAILRRLLVYSNCGLNLDLMLNEDLFFDYSDSLWYNMQEIISIL